VYIDGEQIKFSTFDLISNSLTGIQRGFNGTGILRMINIQWSMQFLSKIVLTTRIILKLGVVTYIIRRLNLQ